MQKYKGIKAYKVLMRPGLVYKSAVVRI